MKKIDLRWLEFSWNCLYSEQVVLQCPADPMVPPIPPLIGIAIRPPPITDIFYIPFAYISKQRAYSRDADEPCRLAPGALPPVELIAI